jgi:hypothetical protein
MGIRLHVLLPALSLPVPILTLSTFLVLPVAFQPALLPTVVIVVVVVVVLVVVVVVILPGMPMFVMVSVLLLAVTLCLLLVVILLPSVALPGHISTMTLSPMIS